MEQKMFLLGIALAAVGSVLGLYNRRRTRREIERVRDIQNRKAKDITRVLDHLRIAVAIRTVDGRKCKLETALIRRLAGLGLRVHALRDDYVREIREGRFNLPPTEADLVLVGWVRDSDSGVVDERSCDARAARPDGRILAAETLCAHAFTTQGLDELGPYLVERLVSVLQDAGVQLRVLRRDEAESLKV